MNEKRVKDSYAELYYTKDGETYIDYGQLDENYMLNETGRREKYERQNSDDSDDSDYDWVPISHG